MKTKKLVLLIIACLYMGNSSGMDFAPAPSRRIYEKKSLKSLREEAIRVGEKNRVDEKIMKELREHTKGVDLDDTFGLGTDWRKKKYIFFLMGQHISDRGMNNLQFAAKQGLVKVVKKLVRHFAPLNAKPYEKTGYYPPLHMAVAYGPRPYVYEVVDVLLMYGADPNKKGSQGHGNFKYEHTPLELAIFEGNLRIFCKLLIIAVNPIEKDNRRLEIEDCNELLLLAKRYGNRPKIVELLTEIKKVPAEAWRRTEYMVPWKTYPVLNKIEEFRKKYGIRP